MTHRTRGLVILAIELQIAVALAIWVVLFVGTVASSGAWQWAIIPGLPLVLLGFLMLLPVTLVGTWLIDAGLHRSRAVGLAAVVPLVALWDLLVGLYFGGTLGDLTSPPALMGALAAGLYAAAFIWARLRVAASSDTRAR